MADLVTAFIEHVQGLYPLSHNLMQKKSRDQFLEKLDFPIHFL